MRQLIQKKNFARRVFRISEAKLFYIYSKFGNENEVDIPFENIDGEKVSHKKSHNILLLIAIGIYIVSIAVFVGWQRGGDVEQFAWLIWTIIGTGFLVAYYFSRENFWKIKLRNNQYIYFHKNLPSKDETDEFIQNLIDSRNNYLVKTYGQIDENLDYKSQLQNFRWLRSIEAITEHEFDSFYENLKRTVKPEKRDIGFGR